MPETKDLSQTIHAHMGQNPDLVTQKSPKILTMRMETATGEKQSVFLHGCAVVSLYNALKINDYPQSFAGFIADLGDRGCLGDKGSINWNKFNNLPDSSLKFSWMQDAEIKGCEPVDLKKLDGWISEGNTALVKVQSLYRKSRRHFMVSLGVEDGQISCLESSDYSGALKIRTLDPEEVLGIRYLEKIAKPASDAT